MDLGGLLVFISVINQLVCLGSAAYSSRASTIDLSARPNSGAVLLLSNPGGPLLLAAGVLGNGAAAGGRRLSSEHSDDRSFDVFYFYCDLEYKATYEIYSGNDSSVHKKLRIKVDKHLGSVIKGEVMAKKYSHDGVTSYVPAKFDVKIGCESKKRYKYQGEDSYLSMDRVALAISNVNKPGEKCAVSKQNLEGTIKIDGYEVVSMMKGHGSFYARTKQVASEKLILHKF